MQRGIIYVKCYHGLRCYKAVRIHLGILSKQHSQVLHLALIEFDTDYAVGISHSTIIMEKMYVISAHSPGRCLLTSHCSDLHFENIKSSYFNVGLLKDTKLIHIFPEEFLNILTDVTADLQGQIQVYIRPLEWTNR